jgi:hypothetical protein
VERIGSRTVDMHIHFQIKNAVLASFFELCSPDLTGGYWRCRKDKG